MQKILSVLFLSFLFLKYDAQIPKVVSGRIERTADFKSQYVTPRNIDVWLPENYSDSRKYAVLYMHDGKMLYDPETTWNKQSWNVDDVISQLIRNGKIQNTIVVGIWNDSKLRHFDYFPQKPFETLTAAEKDTVRSQLKKAGRSDQVFSPNSDNYLKFLVKELKPFIDRKYSTYKNREHTLIAGSSMGGLISMYAICEYPEVFGGAACLSTHWPGTFTLDNNPFPESVLKYLSENLPNPKNHTIYFDCGDQTLDALYPDIQKKADQIMVKAGFTDANWKTLYFPGENHSEEAWNKRLAIPLEFLLKKK
ncbi:alpha/beta hydrolase [Chryseobacterium profundimaris]|uniref:Predicted hydrolase of the alpha/beta superfamily n=1 Tax=Chryseobacterium profundimaris TaxID=1387275 RepID=A0ABY1NTB9_9FLAO|nr:alpha/beta hydrolase-fold protein [Chryseobacterium profundimaris]SMP16752.1 Predicted hydrolase of the alpha/beta superfamily [Chryseobacterium profundimaris]